MTTIITRRRLLCLALAVTGLFSWVVPCVAQNPKLPATYGSVELTSGFMPDPRYIDLLAGGPIRTELGGIRANVANAPAYQLNYTAGPHVLTFYVESAADTTLLIHLPDGTWIADDNSGGSVSPMVRIVNPQAGRYDVFVGTFHEGLAPARLFVTELR